MVTTQVGLEAESAATRFLKDQDFTILDRNWKTRYCEIDIVATKEGIPYFIEVKYRRSNGQGSGLDYITPKKLKQMRFAASVWVQAHRWAGDYRLGAVEISRPAFEVTNFLPDCSL